MNEKFLNICDNVNLIMKSCEYKGFKLKPGMILFNADTEMNLDNPFVAIYDASGKNYDIDTNLVTNPPDEILLKGYLLSKENIENNYEVPKTIKSITPSIKNYNAIRHAVDLALGENKLHRLFLEPKHNRYNKCESFYARCENPDYSYVFKHVIGDIYVQQFTGNRRDKLVTISKKQFEVLDNRMKYGIVPLIDSNSGITINSEFYNFLNTFYNPNYNLYPEDDIKARINILIDYYESATVLNKPIEDKCQIPTDQFVLYNDIGIAFDHATTKDNFNIKPFMIAVTPEFAKKWLYRVIKIKDIIYPDYIYEDLEDLITDDGLHLVYITSIDDYDENDYEDDTITDGNIYKGYYFNGSDFVELKLAIDYDIPNNLDQTICDILAKTPFYINPMKPVKSNNDYKSEPITLNITDFNKKTTIFDSNKIYQDESVIIINEIDTKCFYAIVKHMSEPVTYPKLTNKELNIN